MQYLVLITNHRDLRAFCPIIKVIRQSSEHTIIVAVAGSDFVNDEQNQKTLKDEKIEVDLFLESTTADTTQARSIKLSMINAQLSGFLSYRNIDAVIVNGDTVEAYSTAASAFMNDIPVVHIGGGEITEDIFRNGLRFSISRFSCLHFVPTRESYYKLKQSGEPTSTIHTVGAPEIDYLLSEAVASPSLIEKKYAVKPDEFVLLIQRPELGSSRQASRHITQTLAALREFDYPIIAIEPEIENGSNTIETALRSESRKLKKFQSFKTLPRKEFMGLFRNCRFLIGNTSMGIVEAASFGRMVINIGERQLGRSHAYNVIDVPSKPKNIVEAIEKITDRLVKRASSVKNIYGEGKSAEKIFEILKDAKISELHSKKQLNL